MGFFGVQLIGLPPIRDFLGLQVMGLLPIRDLLGLQVMGLLPIRGFLVGMNWWFGLFGPTGFADTVETAMVAAMKADAAIVSLVASDIVFLLVMRPRIEPVAVICL